MSDLVLVLSALPFQCRAVSDAQFFQLSKALYAFRQRRHLWAVFTTISLKEAKSRSHSWSVSKSSQSTIKVAGEKGSLK
jgi:hypothetical protein